MSTPNDLVERAFKIADESMLELLAAHGVPSMADRTRFGLVDAHSQEVTRLGQADPAITEAFDWLQLRGLATLCSDEHGDFIAVRDPIRPTPAAGRNPFAPDFYVLADKRMSELTDEQKEDARELWLRKESNSFAEPAAQHMQFLLQRLDKVRNAALMACLALQQGPETQSQDDSPQSAPGE